MTIKTHQAVKGTVADPEALRSLCGRSSGRVWLVATITSGANVGDAGEVDCKFCLKIISARAANKR